MNNFYLKYGQKHPYRMLYSRNKNTNNIYYRGPEAQVRGSRWGIDITYGGGKSFSFIAEAEVFCRMRVYE